MRLSASNNLAMWGLCSLLGLLAGPALAAAQEVQVSVAVILASDRDDSVDCELSNIAKEIQKKEPKLTSFHLEKIMRESLSVGKNHAFRLVEDAVVTVAVRHGANEENRVGLTVKAPRQGEIAYTTCCGKFFPIVTRYRTKDKDWLILAIRVQPCKDKEKKDDEP